MTTEDASHSTNDASQQPHVDDILQAMGPRGRYQILHLLVSSLIVFPACFQLLDNVFIIRAVPHNCATPANDSGFWTKYKEVENMTVTYDKCNIKISSHGEVIETEKCVAGIEFEWPVEYSVASQFNLVCENANFAKLAQTLVIGGQGVGAFLITIFSDRYGRKIAMTGSNFGLLVCGLVIAFAPNYIVFAIFKFIIGAFQQGVLTSQRTYCLELFVMKDRRAMSVFGGLVWTAAAVSMPLCSYLLRFESWRYLQVAFTLTSLGVFLQCWFLDESIRWLFANGKTEAAMKCIQRACRYNKKDYNTILKIFPRKMEVTVISTRDDFEMSLDSTATPGGNESAEVSNEDTVGQPLHITAAKKMTLIDLLRVRRLLINAVSIWFAWFTVALGYFTIYLTATSLHGDPFVNFALVAMMNFPGQIFFFLSVNRCGRKFTTMTLFGFLGGGLVVVGISNYMQVYNLEAFGKLSLVGSMFAMMGAAGSFGCVFFYTPEMFPTNFRNQALGLSSFVGRFGGMMAPFTGVLADKAVWAPGALIGGCAIVVCLLIGLVLPETKKKELPQTVAELQAWYTDKKTTKRRTAKESIQ